MNPTDSDFRPSDREKLLTMPEVKKKGFWHKVGSGLKNAGVSALETAANILMAGKGGED